MSMKNPNDIIGNRSRDLRASQQTAPPHVPYSIYKIAKNIDAATVVFVKNLDNVWLKSCMY
jgi:hypothetical protein